MMGLIEIISMIPSLIKLSLALTGKSNSAKFQGYKAEGLGAKESKQLAKAMRFYKKALSYAETNEQRADIWFLIIHIHTDRMIGASQQWTNYTGHILEWRWGPNNIPSNYQKPPQKELIRG